MADANDIYSKENVTLGAAADIELTALAPKLNVLSYYLSDFASLQSAGGVTRPYERDINADLTEAVALMYGRNVAKGWWTDIKSGAPLDRNPGELIALIHSEISEGFEGIMNGVMDDKLKYRPMIGVELADAAIRYFDTCGGFGYDLGGAAAELLPILDFRKNYDETSLWFDLGMVHLELSRALEGVRKNSMDKDLPHRRKVEVRLAAALLRTFFIAAADYRDLGTIIAEKQYVNSVRPDHKIENRLLEDGKKF